MGNEKEPVKMRRTMQAFLKKLGGHKGSKQRKNFPQLVQAVIEADNEASQIQEDGAKDNEQLYPELSVLSDAKPEPIPLFMGESIDDPQLELNEVGLQTLMYRLMDREIVVLSICGPSRNGKSTLLCFVARFLKYLVELDHLPSRKEVESFDWIRNGPEFLEKVFRCEAGVRAVTNGIQLWLEPFIIGDIAYLLMDVQGLFDSDTSAQGNAKLCTLAMLLSSDLIYNIRFTSLTTDILERVFTFVNYAREMVRSNPGQEAPPTKFLQNFYLVGRDFESPQNYEYGWEGGTNYLNDELDKNVYRDMKQSFGEHFARLMCALLPHPGNDITSHAWTGRISNFRAEFVNEMKSFVENLFGHLTVKQTTNGNAMTFSEWLDCLRLYIGMFNNGNLPRYEGIYEAQVKSHLRNVIECSRSVFNAKLIILLKEIEENNAGKPKTNEQVTECLKKSKMQAMSEFGKFARLGTLQQINEHRVTLEAALQKEIETTLRSNIKDLHVSKLDDQIKMALILTAGGFIVGGGIGLLASVGAGALVGAGLIEGTGAIGGAIKAIGGAKLVSSITGAASLSGASGIKGCLGYRTTRKEANEHDNLAKELAKKL